MSTRSSFVPSLLALLPALAGCGSVLSHPGDDFSVAVATPAPADAPVLDLQQAVGKVPLRFRVDGCAAFTATISASGAAESPLDDVTRADDGGWIANVDADLLHAKDDYCGYDVQRPMDGYARLTVTCAEDGRTTSTDLRTRYAPAWRVAYRGRGPSDGVLAGATPGKFFDVGAGWLDAVDEGEDVGAETPAAIAASTTPLLLATTDGNVYLHGGCPINDCGLFTIADTPSEKVYTMGGYLQEFRFDGRGADFVRNVKVPAQAIDLARDADGTIVVLTEETSASLLTRVAGESTTANELAGESSPTKLATRSGQRVFLTRVNDDRARLHALDGSVLGEIPIPGAGGVSYLSLAPTGDAFVAIRGGQPWLVTLAGDAPGVGASAQVPIATTLTGFEHNTYEDSSFGAAWTDSFVAIRNASGVEVFDRKQPSTRVWSFATDRRYVIGALPLANDVLAVQTQTGIRLYDKTGALIGGADPMPEACALDYEPHHAAVVAPDIVALSGKRSVYQFKVTLP